MADNSTLPVAGGGTETFANDDIGSVKYPRIKVTWGADGSSVDASAANPLPVVQTGTHNVTQTGTWTVQPGNTPNTTPWLVKLHDGTNAVAVKAASTAAQPTDPSLVVQLSPVGEVTHGSADSGAPAKIGFKAIAGLSGATLVTAAQRTDGYAGLDGAQITRPHCGLEDIVDGAASNTDGTSTSVIAAAGSGVKQYLTSVSIVNMHASTVVYVELKSGTTVKYRLPCPPGGTVQNFQVPLKPNAANEAWNFHPSAAVTTLYCSMVGFKSKV